MRKADTQTITTMLAEGRPTKDIMLAVGCSKATVSRIRRELPPPPAKPKYAIEKDIPLHKQLRRGGPPPRFPFALLDIGDSFFVPASDASPKGMRNAVAVYRKRTGKHFATRICIKGDIPGTRIWRIAGKADTPKKEEQ
jgi:hypothetical protein